MTERREITHCQHRFTPDLKCLKCGAYNHINQAVKTTKYSSPFHFHLKHYLSSLRSSATHIIEPRELSEDTHLLLSSICEKFLFTSQTLALGIYIYQSLNKLNTNQKFWASVCLILAGKSGELDKNVPYLNRYQRYADKSFSQFEYEQAERTAFESMNFQVQYSSFITFLDFYLTCGVLYKSDNINESLVEFFEDDVITRGKEFLKKGTFTKYHPESLALAIIKQIRLKYNLEGWIQALQELSGYKADDIISVNPAESPLKELNHNALERLIDIKGLNGKKKYQYPSKNEKPALQKFSSISRSTNLKQNSYSTSKLLVQGNSRKPSHNFIITEGFVSINSQLLSKRR